MHEYHSERYGNVVLNRNAISSFDFEAIFELLHHPDLGQDAFDEIEILTSRCGRLAQSVIYDSFHDLTEDSTPESARASLDKLDVTVDGNSIRAWIDLLMETDAIDFCLDYVFAQRKSGEDTAPSELTKILMDFVNYFAQDWSQPRPEDLPTDASAAQKFDRQAQRLLKIPEKTSKEHYEPVSRSSSGVLQGLRLIASTALKALQEEKAFRSSGADKSSNIVIDLTAASDDDVEDAHGIDGTEGRSEKPRSAATGSHTSMLCTSQKATNSATTEEDSEAHSLLTNAGSFTEPVSRKEDLWRANLQVTVDWMNDQDLEWKCDHDTLLLLSTEEREALEAERSRRVKDSFDSRRYAELTAPFDAPSYQHRTLAAVPPTAATQPSSVSLGKRKAQDTSEPPDTTTSSPKALPPPIKCNASHPVERVQIWYRHVPCCKHKDCQARGHCLPPEFNSRKISCRDCQKGKTPCLARFWLTQSRVEAWADAKRRGKPDLEADQIA